MWICYPGPLGGEWMVCLLTKIPLCNILDMVRGLWLECSLRHGTVKNVFKLAYFLLSLAVNGNLSTVDGNQGHKVAFILSVEKCGKRINSVCLYHMLYRWLEHRSNLNSPMVVGLKHISPNEIPFFETCSNRASMERLDYLAVHLEVCMMQT